jgi:zinc-binding alcohol dehydrogenase/oxidoreductase
MKSLVLKAINTPFEIQETEKPQPKEGEVLIKIAAAAINHRDLWIQKGQYAGLKFPIILGSDGSGIVEAAGVNTDNSLIGKAVVINPSQHWGNNQNAQSKDFKILGLPENGTFAEYVCVAIENVVPKPPLLSFEEAAALPLAGLTAYRALFSRAKATSSDKVLISGIGGGVALFAMQFAIAAGAKVYVTSGNNDKIERAKELGATGGINYNTDNWQKLLLEESSGFDVIIDSAAGESFNKLIDVANPGARIAFYGGTNGNFNNLNPQKIFWKQLSLLGSTMGSAEEFSAMIKFVEQKQITPVVDSVFNFNDAQKAINRMAQKEQFGKIVLSFNHGTSH